MKRVIIAAKAEPSEGFSDALNKLDDDVSYAMSGLEILGARNEAAAKDILDRFSQMVNNIISEIGSAVS